MQRVRDMNKLKDSVFTKIIAFIMIQVCVVTMFFSGIVIFFNAGYSWYSSDYYSAREDILQEIAVSLECEIYDWMYYNLEYSTKTDEMWSEYILPEYDLPEGIGYNLTFLKNVNKNTDNIKLEKNTTLAGRDDVYSQNFSNDLYELTVYVADPVEFAIPASELYPEELAARYKLFDFMFKYNKTAIACFVAGLIIMVLLLAYMIISMRTGERNGALLKKIPVDLVCVITVCLNAVMVMCLGDISVDYSNYDVIMLCVTVAVLLISVVSTSFILFFIYRMRCGRWWSGTVMCAAVKYLIRLLKLLFVYIKRASKWAYVKLKKTAAVINYGIRKIPTVWKAAVVTLAVMILNLIIMVNFAWSDAAQFFWFVGAAVVSVAVIYLALCIKRLQRGGQKLAEGDLNYKVNVNGLFMEFAEHAENLNKISDGIAAAVEERIKSERFKAELITNVSHDIKTPLTSIINYVELLSKEKIKDPKIREYIEVLDRQSKRLKKLTEDLVDASKASTGNVKMEMAPCNIGLLMTQSIGEYNTKAENNGLEFVIKIPEDDLEILADGRRLWRVFDNLLNNICKYGQPGTRVYLTLEEDEGKAVITYRNISKYELDISEKELMERFVRGDKSRHTEGSGLGLSIARNLVELQGGNFEISIDGDLFKVVVTFNLLKI